MRTSMARAAVACQEQPASPTDLVQGRDLSLLRNIIDASAWTHEALATVLPVPNAAYISRMLSGEKPWTLRHLAALPDDIASAFHARKAEAHGFIVVRPMQPADAVEHLVGALVALLTDRLPRKADHMAKAGVYHGVERRRA